MELAKNALVLVAIEKERCRLFEHGLRREIRTSVTATTAWYDYAELVEATLRVEKV